MNKILIVLMSLIGFSFGMLAFEDSIIDISRELMNYKNLAIFTAVFAFSEILANFFNIHILKYKFNPKKVSIYTLILSAIFLVFSIFVEKNIYSYLAILIIVTFLLEFYSMYTYQIINYSISKKNFPTVDIIRITTFKVLFALGIFANSWLSTFANTKFLISGIAIFFILLNCIIISKISLRDNESSNEKSKVIKSRDLFKNKSFCIQFIVKFFENVAFFSYIVIAMREANIETAIMLKGVAKLSISISYIIVIYLVMKNYIMKSALYFRIIFLVFMTLAILYKDPYLTYVFFAVFGIAKSAANASHTYKINEYLYNESKTEAITILNITIKISKLLILPLLLTLNANLVSLILITSMIIAIIGNIIMVTKQKDTLQILE